VESSTRNRIRIARCPDCGAEVRLDGRLLVGEVFGCEQCSAQIEVASPDPLELVPFARIEAEEEDFV
jgi:lysine biosynthesis protein LysW